MHTIWGRVQDSYVRTSLNGEICILKVLEDVGSSPGQGGGNGGQTAERGGVESWCTDL